MKHIITAIISDRKNKVLSIGKNNYTKTHPIQAKHAKKVGEPMRNFLHAEINAIVRCKDIDSAHRIQIFRYGKDGIQRLAKPCPICMSAIEATRIKVIEFTTEMGIERVTL